MSMCFTRGKAFFVFIGVSLALLYYWLPQYLWACNFSVSGCMGIQIGFFFHELYVSQFHPVSWGGSGWTVL